MSDFLNQVTGAFQRLIARGLVSIESSRYDPTAFGNAVVVLAGGDLRLRLVRDRGQVLAEAGSRLHPDAWFPLQRVLSAVGVLSPPSEGLVTPEEAANMVEQHLSSLEAGLGTSRIDETKHALAELDRKAAERFRERQQRRLH